MGVLLPVNHTPSVKVGRLFVCWLLKGATSQVAGIPAVLDRTVIVLDRTIIVLDRTIIVLDRIVIVLDRSVIAIYGIFSLNFLLLGGGSDHLWLLRAARHTSAPALPTLSILSSDRYVNKTLPRAGLFPGARSCAFNVPATCYSVSQGRICSDNFTCCHTEIEVADQTFHLTQSQYTYTGPTSPSTDPITPDTWQGAIF